MQLKTSKQYRVNVRDAIQSAITAGISAIAAIILPAIYHYFHAEGWTDFGAFQGISLSLTLKAGLYAGLGDLGRRFFSKSKLIWTKVSKSTVDAVQEGAEVKIQIKSDAIPAKEHH